MRQRQSESKHAKERARLARENAKLDRQSDENLNRCSAPKRTGVDPGVFQFCVKNLADTKSAAKPKARVKPTGRLVSRCVRVQVDRAALIAGYDVDYVKPNRHYVSDYKTPEPNEPMLAHRWTMDGVKYVMYPAYDYAVYVEEKDYVG